MWDPMEAGRLCLEVLPNDESVIVARCCLVAVISRMQRLPVVSHIRILNISVLLQL